MRQVLHIFRKDALRFWPEILISLSIVAAFAWVYPAHWLETDSLTLMSAGRHVPHKDRLTTLATTLQVLVPVSWWLLIARVVHAETLVGDRQFWITRPYEWPKLLAAKVLFLGVFLYVPFFAAQWVLLVEAGFHPAGYVWAMLYELVLVTGILVVPLMALTVVTSNFARLTLTILGIILAVAGVVFLATFFDLGSETTPFSDRFSIPVVLVMGGSAIVQQYARRKVWLSRALLAALVGTVFATGWIGAGLSDLGSVDTAYPGLAGVADAAIQFSFVTNPDEASRANGGVSPGAKEDEVLITIPLSAEGVVPGRAVMVDNAKASIDGPNGMHWSSPWRTAPNSTLLPGDWTTSVSFMMKRVDYERMRASRVTLKLHFALTEVRAGKPTQIPISEEKFQVPQLGICSVSAGWAEAHVFDAMECLSAMHDPSLMYVTATASTAPCAGDPPTTETAMVVTGDGSEGGAQLGKDTQEKARAAEEVRIGSWVGGLNPDPAEFGITSVWANPVNLWAESDGVRREHFLCPGKTLTFTPYELERRLQEQLTIANFQLPAEKKTEMRLRLLK